MNEILSVIKLRLYPDEKTAYCLDDQSRKCSSLYNKLLTQANQILQDGNKDEFKTIYSSYGLRNLVPRMKELHPYLKSVYAAPLKNTALRMASAFQNAAQSKRKGKKVNRPRFYVWKQHWFSLLYDEPFKGYSIAGNKLHLSLGMGLDRKRHSIQITVGDAHLLKEKDVRNLRIVKEYGLFSAVFTIAQKIPNKKPIKKVIALDPNHKNLFYGVDNTDSAHEIQAPHWLKIYDRRVDELRSKLDACLKKSKKREIVVNSTVITYWEESRRYKRLKKTLDRVLAKRRELTKLFCYRIAHELCKQYDFIAIGDYAPQGQGITTAMRRSMNNRSIIGKSKSIIKWVALKSGKTYYEFDETGTTRTCHACGFIMQAGIHPSIREWLCPGCLTTHIRDENAACNGLQKAYSKISEEQSLLVPRSGRVHINERWAWKILSSGGIVRRGGKIADDILHFQEMKTNGVVAIRPGLV